MLTLGENFLKLGMQKAFLGYAQNKQEHQQNILAPKKTTPAKKAQEAAKNNTSLLRIIF